MKLLITDLDNTLYDWVTFYAHAFKAMVDALVPVVGVAEGVLLDEFQAVHRSYGNSEQPFAVFELPSVHARFGALPRSKLKEALDPALHAFNSARKQHLNLYACVAGTLAELTRRGVPIIGHTEAIAENALFRLRTLGIMQHFRHLYVLDGRVSPHPDPERQATLRAPEGFVRVVPVSERKPNPQLLLDICSREGVGPSECWYVGDSLTRDVGMAKAAGVAAVWAEYGTKYDKALWDRIVRITHWTNEDVSREATIRERFRAVRPDYTIQAFSELLDHAGMAHPCAVAAKC